MIRVLMTYLEGFIFNFRRGKLDFRRVFMTYIEGFYDTSKRVYGTIG